MPDSLDAPADKSEGNPIIPTLGQLRIAWENEEYDDYYQLLMQF